MPEDDQQAPAWAGFPSTHRSAVIAVKSPDAAVRAWSLDVLALAYWRPVYSHIRMRWQRDVEASQDLTQEFFARALEKGTFDGYDPDRGRFRTFLRTCLDRFVLNEAKAERRLKRGGGRLPLSLDFAGLEQELAEVSAASPETPDGYFDREWIKALYGASVEALQKDLEARDKAVYFRVFERYVLSEDPDDKPSYASIASELGLSVTDVTNYLAYARREFRRVVLERVRQLTATEEEFQEEVRAVLGV